MTATEEMFRDMSTHSHEERESFLPQTHRYSSEHKREEGPATSAFYGRTLSKRDQVLVGVIGLLSVICAALGGTVVHLLRTPNDVFRHVPASPRLEVVHTSGVMPPILGPEFTKKTVLFQRNESFMGDINEAYPAWHDILHRARHGRVAFDSRPGEFFGVAGYHQLHCVWLAQQAVYDAVNGIKPQDVIADHMFHCVEYLRQSVMCYADPTLERRFQGILGPFSANNTHVCGDWDKLMDWADDHIYLGPYLNPEGKLPP